MIFIAKISLFFLVMAILNVLRETAHLINCFVTLDKYHIGNARTALLWVSISYIITVIILGI